MKRDIELMRRIVFAIEESPHAFGFAPDELTIEGYSEEQIGYHALLLIDEGLAVGQEVTDMGSASPEAIIYRLTSKGHDFAQTSRDESRWKQVISVTKEKGGGIVFDILRQLLTQMVKDGVALR